MARKKVLGLFLALTVAAGSFAVPVGDSGLDISGTINTGIRVQGWQTQDYDGPLGHQTVDFYSNEIGDDAGTGLGVDVNFDYTKGNVGASVTLRARDADTHNWFKIDHAYGYAKAFNNMFKVTAGYNLNGVWGTGAGSSHNWIDSGIDGSRSVRLEGLLLDGALSIGAAFINGSDLGGNENVGGSLGFLPLVEHLKFTTVGAAYTSDAFKASFAMTFNAAKVETEKHADGLNHIFWDYGNWVFPYEADGGDPFKNHTYFRALGGVSYLGIQNLQISVDFDGAAVSNKYVPGWGGDFTSKYNYFKITPAATYSMGAFGVSLFLPMELYDVDSGASGSKKYANGNFAVRLVPSYKINDNLSVDLRIQETFDAFENQEYKEANAWNGKAEDYKGGNTFQLRPRLKVNFGNGASFYTYYRVDIKTPVKSEDKDPKVTTVHQLQLEFTYSF